MALTKASNSTLNLFTKYNDSRVGITATSGPGIYIIGTSASGTYYTSSDGFTWTTRSSGPQLSSNPQSDQLFFRNGQFEYFAFQSGGAGSFGTSTSGTSWTSGSRVAAFENNFSAAPAQVFLDSTNNYQRAARSGSTTGWWLGGNDKNSQIFTSSYDNLSGAGFFNNLYIAAGWISNSTISVFTSPDLVTWTTRSSGFFSGAPSNGGMKLVSSQNEICIFGQRRGVARSTNGTTFTETNSDTSNFYQNGWYAGGYFWWGRPSGQLAYSTNGISFTGVTSGLSGDVRGVFFGNGVYVAFDSNGIISTSTNLSSWTVRATGLSSSMMHGVYA